MKKILFTILFLILVSTLAQAQRASYFRRLFVDAEYYLLYEEYRDALPLYLELYEAYPENTNISFRLGLCYLNIPNEKHKAIPFLEQAVEAITRSYREGYFTETQAPPEALLYLGKAYRIAAEFENASEAFTKYLKMIEGNNEEAKNLVANEIIALNYAQELMDNPLDVKFISAGRTVNTRFPEINPVVSADTNVLVYTSVQQFYNAIMLSNRRARVWTHPFNLNNQLSADGAIRTVGISADGNKLLLARNDNDVFNIYVSHFDPVKKNWSTISRLPREINSRNWENYASFSPSGDTLYFSSNRPEGIGGFDIYMSVRTATGWSEATNLGEVINTSFDEIAPAISHDGKKLFFSSKGHQTMGGFDIFVSEKIDGKWSKPINLRYPINTTDDDVFFHPIGDGSTGFVSRLLPQSFGENDIYIVRYDLDSLISSSKNTENSSGTFIKLEDLVKELTSKTLNTLKP